MDDAPLQVPDTSPPGTPVSSSRRVLDRRVIVSEAVRFIDEQGRDQLTMRQLGARLGVEAMALYRYVPSRDHLLDGVVELVMEELYRDSLVDQEAATWQEYLQRLAHGVRVLALAHPEIFPLVATRPPAAPWLRPPLRSLRWVEAFLAGLRDFGFSSSATVYAYRAFATFLLGHLLLETGGTAVTAAPERRGDMELLESNDLSLYPRITELADELGGGEYQEEFEAALEDLINRLQLVVEDERSRD